MQIRYDPMEVELLSASVLDRVSGWSGRPRTAEPLPGGITNRNYRMAIDGEVFIGEQALTRAKDNGIRRRLRPVLLENPAAITFGDEPVRVNGQVAGRATSGGFGYTIERSIAYAYLPPEGTPGDTVEVQVFGRWVPAVVAREPLYDPSGDRIRS